MDAPPGNNVSAIAPGDAAAQATNNGHNEADDYAMDVLNLGVDGDRIVTRAPEEPFRLTFIDVTCLLVNRTIGTGIFNGPKEVMKGARTPAIALLMWFCGCIYCLAGSHVFLEYGLNVPRYVIDGVEQSVPRSGGELHYLQYVFSHPRYKKDTIVLISVMFGLSFICVGNMASNCIDCALRLLALANMHNAPESTTDTTAGYNSRHEALVRGIAIAIATVTCFIHAFSRRGGIILNNVFAVVKLLFLVSIVLATWVVAGGRTGLYGFTAGTEADDIKPPPPPPGSDEEHNSFAQAFLFVVFAFFGFDQPSYVLGEIKHPRKNFPRAMWWGMGMMLIVPADVQRNANNVAEEFFARIFHSKPQAKATVDAFLAISSFGNVVVWTFTAARMKQEIAKQCYLPFSKFFAMEKDISLGRFLLWLEGSKTRSERRRISFLNPSNHREKTPVGAFALHLISCIILICATFGIESNDAYITLSSLFSYLLAAWFGAFLALGILILHIRGPPATQPVQTPNHNRFPNQVAVKRTWREITKRSVNPTMSIICAVLYLAGSLFPVFASWVKPPGKKQQSVAWFVVPVAAMCILGFATLWFCGFLAIAKYRKSHRKLEFFRVSAPEFDWADKRERTNEEDGLADDDGASVRRRGGLILLDESIYPAWRPGVRSSTMMVKRKPVGSGLPHRGWNSSWHMGSGNESDNGDLANAHLANGHSPRQSHARPDVEASDGWIEPRSAPYRAENGSAMH